jgi:ribosomal protein S27E
VPRGWVVLTIRGSNGKEYEAMADLTEVKCSNCSGTGKIYGTAQTNVGHYWGPMACPTCRGWGAIPTDLQARIEEGARLKQEARERGMTLSREAKRLGVPVTELSRKWWPASDREWNEEAGREFREWSENTRREWGEMLADLEADRHGE